MRSSNTEEFINKARKLNGDRYDYSETAYVNNVEKVIIHCRLHGPFLQSPGKHLSGRHCPVCGHTKRIRTKSSTKEEFVKLAEEKHLGLYDYSKVSYKNSQTKVVIICKKHELEFKQTPAKHLTGNGCPECGKFKGREKNVEYLPWIKSESKRKFGNKFDYSKVDTNSKKLTTTIICNKHGEMRTSLFSHINSEFGCKQCELDYKKANGKKCTQCNEFKPLEEFHSLHITKDKRAAKCKSCVSYNLAQPVPYSRYKNDLTVEDGPTEINGILHVKCKKCSKLFQPKTSQYRTRVEKLKNVAGESHFYCSEDCKDSCDIFHAINTPKSSRFKTSRDCYKTTRKALLDSQCGAEGYTYCEACGDIINTDLHHTNTIKENKNNLTDVSGVILLCPGCHVKLHTSC